MSNINILQHFSPHFFKLLKPHDETHQVIVYLFLFVDCFGHFCNWELLVA